MRYLDDLIAILVLLLLHVHEIDPLILIHPVLIPLPDF